VWRYDVILPKARGPPKQSRFVWIDTGLDGVRQSTKPENKTMSEQFINTADDMDWLFEVHVGNNLAISWKPRSAVLFGNEDCPERIDLYPRKNPLVTDTPLTGTLYHANVAGNRTHNDNYQFCGPLQADEALRIDAEERASEELTTADLLKMMPSK
jgi:hypothetical protein